MLDLAFALALENAGLGKYGDTIWFGTSPVLSDGSVSADTGVWVNLTAGSANHAVKTATITISTRADDVVYQGLLDAHIHDWCDNVLPAMCELSCHPIIELSYRLISVSASQAETLEAVDSEGRWVKTITIQVSYQLSGKLPSLEDYEAIE